MKLQTPLPVNSREANEPPGLPPPEIAALRRHSYRCEYEQEPQHQAEQGPCDIGSPWPAMVGRFVASCLHVTPSLVGCIGQTWVSRKFFRECETVHTTPNFGIAAFCPRGALVSLRKTPRVISSMRLHIKDRDSLTGPGKFDDLPGDDSVRKNFGSELGAWANYEYAP